jgi:hypothetical protein
MMVGCDFGVFCASHQGFLDVRVLLINVLHYYCLFFQFLQVLLPVAHCRSSRPVRIGGESLVRYKYIQTY